MSRRQNCRRRACPLPPATISTEPPAKFACLFPRPFNSVALGKHGKSAARHRLPLLRQCRRRRTERLFLRSNFAAYLSTVCRCYKRAFTVSRPLPLIVNDPLQKSRIGLVLALRQRVFRAVGQRVFRAVRRRDDTLCALSMRIAAYFSFYVVCLFKMRRTVLPVVLHLDSRVLRPAA